jgi:translation initiation factor 1
MTVRHPRDRALVYSTELGRTCPACRRSLTECRCKANDHGVLGDGHVRVGRETKGRAGKGVTVITGLPLDAAGLAALATTLKKRCGSGGTVRDGVIEIQGDHRDVVVAQLATAGFKARKAGG